MATSDYGLFSYGLEIPTYDAWQEEYFALARTYFGPDINLNTTSKIGQILSIPCYQDIQILQMLEAVYNSQRLTGAEGIYLDDILNRRGVFRKPAQKGTGYTFVHTNSNATWTYNISTATYFTAKSGQNYRVSVNTQLRDRIVAYKLTLSQFNATPGTTVTFYIVDRVTGLLKSQVIAKSSSNPLGELANFIKSSIDPSDIAKVFVNNNTLYFGFISSDLNNVNSLNYTVKFYANTSLGEKWSLVPVVAENEGVYSVNIGDITNMTPTPNSGYMSVGNFSEFYSGSEVETDAEYRARFDETADEALAASLPAVYKAVSDLAGVSKVRIYDNATMDNKPEASAFTFNTIVYGGDPDQIAQTLYTKKPINALTDGTTSVTVSGDNGTEIIRFTVAKQVGYTIKIQYRRVDERAFTDTEQETIKDAFDKLTANFKIGTKIFNAQLQAAVYNSVQFGEISFLTLLSKPNGSADSNYSALDIVPDFDEIVTIDSDDIIFEQIV